MGPALFIIGLIVNLIGWGIVVVMAFRESLGWGLAVIFIPFAYIVFVVQHWQETKKAFLTGVVGTLVIMAGVMANPSRPQPSVAEPAQIQASMVPETTTHATFEQVTARASEPAPAPVTYEEPVQPVFAQVWADSSTRLYYPKDCAKHPENAFLLAKSAATSQGFKAAACK
ncbi:MAG: hypothetical protein M3041_14410 [Acidobacteriota bacterium]|nr:hypothetical protein [Acidobacteriota bacterium]